MNSNLEIQTCNKEGANDAENSYPSFKTGQWVPLKFNPCVRRKLGDNSLDFTPVGWDLVQSSPVIFLIYKFYIAKASRQIIWLRIISILF